MLLSRVASALPHSVSIASVVLSLSVLSTAYCSAEEIRLRSGGTLQGEIIFRNEEIVVLKDATGARFQYPMSEVDSIYIVAEQPRQEEESNQHSKKVSLVLSAGAGASFLPRSGCGATFGMDLAIGTANLFDRRIFVGGAFGYRGMFFDNRYLSSACNFLPLQVRFEAPFIIHKHAPQLGIGLGYAIPVGKNIKGGLLAEAQIAWRYQYSDRSALIISLYAEAINARLTATEYISNLPYSVDGPHTFCNTGAKITIAL